MKWKQGRLAEPRPACKCFLPFGSEAWLFPMITGQEACNSELRTLCVLGLTPYFRFTFTKYPNQNVPHPLSGFCISFFRGSLWRQPLTDAQGVNKCCLCCFMCWWGKRGTWSFLSKVMKKGNCLQLFCNAAVCVTSGSVGRAFSSVCPGHPLQLLRVFRDFMCSRFLTDFPFVL